MRPQFETILTDFVQEFLEGFHLFYDTIALSETRVASDVFEKPWNVEWSANILIRIACQEIDVRGINEVLVSRNDLSPFLVHLTREYDGRSPQQNLTRILNSRRLKYGNEPMSVARYRYPYGKISTEQMKTYFKAVSF